MLSVDHLGFYEISGCLAGKKTHQTSETRIWRAG